MSREIVTVPIPFGTTMASVQANVVTGLAPLLLSKATLKRMRCILDLGEDKAWAIVGGEKFELPIKVSSTGHYVLPLLDDE